MKFVKKFTAFVLAALMTLSLSACVHKKDEIAVTVNDVEFTSAYYMCALINAKAEAEQKVSEDDSLSDAEKNGTTAIDYFSKKIDKKKFADWVEDRAIEILTETASYKILCEKNGLKISDEKLSDAKNTALYQWQNYGYSSYFEPNGVSYSTYEKFVIDAYYYDVYFDSIYGKDGSKALKAEDVNKEITDNYVLADVLAIPFNEDDTDEAKAQTKQVLEDYAKEISAGNTTFIDVYKAYNGIEDTETEEAEDEEELAPVNTYATIIGSDKTDYHDASYDIIKALTVDVPKVIDNEDKSGVTLYIKRDLNADQYYADYLDTVARHTLADEEYEKEVAKHTKKLKADINKYAINQFKVKDIIVPENA